MTKGPKEVSSETTVAEQKPHLYAPGQSGNPKGRPPGSRNKLGEEFVADLQAHWKVHGTDAINRVCKERPQDYLKVVASILPKQLEIKETPFDGVSDEIIAAFLAAARAAFSDDSQGGEGAIH